MRTHAVLLAAALPLMALAAAMLLLAADGAEATHLRGGTLAWEPTGAPDEVDFRGTVAWRTSSWTSPPPTMGDVLRTSGVPHGFWLETGEGGVHEVFYLEVIHMDPVEDWLLSRIVNTTFAPGVRHTYPAPDDGGQPWRPYWTECCRLTNYPPNEHVNNPGDATTLTTDIDLTAVNAAPGVWVPPVFSCERDTLCKVPITAWDPDGDALSYRFSTSDEAIGSGHPPTAPTGNTFDPPGPPWSMATAYLDASVSAVMWDTTGVFMGVGGVPHYSVQFMTEDGSTKTPMDFLIKIEEVDPPFWVKPPSPCSQTLRFPVGASSSFTVEAAHNTSAKAVDLFINPATPLARFDGATSPLPTPGNPVSTTFAWTPSASDAGLHRITYMAHTGNHWAAPCDVRLQVVDPPAADFVCAPVTGADGRVAFTDLSKDNGNLSAWLWSFGDASTSAGRHPVHDYPTRGDWNVSLRVWDEDGLDDAVSRTCFADANRPPFLEPVPPHVVYEGQEVSFAVHAGDPDGDAVLVRMLPGLSPPASYEEGFSWHPVAGMAGTYEVVFVASDGRLEDRLTVRIRVLPGPDEPAPASADADGDGSPDAHDACPAAAGPDGGCPAPTATAEAAQGTDHAPLNGTPRFRHTLVENRTPEPEPCDPARPAPDCPPTVDRAPPEGTSSLPDHDGAAPVSRPAPAATAPGPAGLALVLAAVAWLILLLVRRRSDRSR